MAWLAPSGGCSPRQREHKLYAQRAADTNQPVLPQLAVWCVGEYGELLVSTPIADCEQPTPTEVVEVAAVF